MELKERRLYIVFANGVKYVYYGSGEELAEMLERDYPNKNYAIIPIESDALVRV